MKGHSLRKPALLHNHVAAVVSLAQEVRRYDADAQSAAAQQFLGFICRHANAQGCGRLEAEDSRKDRSEQC